jgi:hypothetical protein
MQRHHAKGGEKMKGKITQALLAICASLTIAGCSNGYRQFYTPASGATPELISASRASAAPESPTIERSAFGDTEQILAGYAKRGYLIIGESSFNTGESVSDDDALEQGQAVGADLVLVFVPKYTGSVTSSVPLTTPTTNTSYTTANATAYGPGGPVSAYGNATTTTYGTSTTYIPVTVNRSDYGAVYFIKGRFKIGVLVRNLNDLERQMLQTNQGVVVTTIVDDSPAYRADILPGDTIIAMDGERVSNQEAFTRMASARTGRTINLSLIRQGHPIEKTLQAGN